MLPPTEFSIGRMPRLARPFATAAKTSSKLRHGITSLPGAKSCAAASLYAPGSPWNAIVICGDLKKKKPARVSGGLEVRWTLLLSRQCARAAQLRPVEPVNELARVKPLPRRELSATGGQ